MTALATIFTVTCVIAGVVFFLAGTVGLLRFPDPLSRIHALSKADNLGLGLVVLGLIPQAPDFSSGLKLAGVWLLAQLSAATVSQIMAGVATHDERQP
jgi:multicomponent Na+:H+ antiporter subunit G